MGKNRWSENIFDFIARPLKMLGVALWRHPETRRFYRAALKKCDLMFSAKIPQGEIEAIVGRAPSCLLENPTRKDGNLSLDAQYCIASLIRFLNPERIFEIGTFNGNTTLQMAVNSKPDCKICTLDLPSGKREGSGTKYSLAEDDKKYVGSPEIVFLGTPHEKKITRLFGDSAQFDFRPYYGQMDFIFIDGSHAYDYVKNDTEQAFRMLGPKGMIVWDDYDASWPEVIRYLDELALKEKIVWIRGTGLCLYERP